MALEIILILTFAVIVVYRVKWEKRNNRRPMQRTAAEEAELFHSIK